MSSALIQPDAIEEDEGDGSHHVKVYQGSDVGFLSIEVRLGVFILAVDPKTLKHYIRSSPEEFDEPFDPEHWIVTADVPFQYFPNGRFDRAGSGCYIHEISTIAPPSPPPATSMVSTVSTASAAPTTSTALTTSAATNASAEFRSTFPLLDFPQEIADKIWGHTLPEGRIVKLTANYRKGQYRCDGDMIAPEGVAEELERLGKALSLTCKASHGFWRDAYQRMKYFGPCASENGSPSQAILGETDFFIDGAVDTLFLDVRVMRSVHTPQFWIDVTLIEHVAIGVDFHLKDMTHKLWEFAYSMKRLKTLTIVMGDAEFESIHENVKYKLVEVGDWLRDVKIRDFDNPTSPEFDEDSRALQLQDLMVGALALNSMYHNVSFTDRQFWDRVKFKVALVGVIWGPGYSSRQETHVRTYIVPKVPKYHGIAYWATLPIDRTIEQEKEHWMEFPALDGEVACTYHGEILIEEDESANGDNEDAPDDDDDEDQDR